MITAPQIQTVLNHASKAPTTVGEALTDAPAIQALVAFGSQLHAGKVLRLYTPSEAAIADAAIEASIAPIAKVA